MNKINTSNFKLLIGNWKTAGTIEASNEIHILDGFDSYELILNGNFILHKADVRMGNERSETVELISLDESADKARMHYFNSKGKTGVMTGYLNNNEFEIDGSGIKFIGAINEQATEITGKWFLQKKNNDWENFIQLKLIKIN